MINALVLGSGGMLGSAIKRQLCTQQNIKVYKPTTQLNWTNPKILNTQLDSLLSEFMNNISPQDQWEIYWAAGIGAMGSNQNILESETVALDEFLKLLNKKQTVFCVPGFLGFASSAGALYSSNSDFYINEHSKLNIQTDYAKSKLAQEQLLYKFASNNPCVKILIARFSTIYGPGQSFHKRQGLLTHIARSTLKKEPVEIFVPLDTLRDYIFSDDAADIFIKTLRQLSDDISNYKIRIISSEQSVTISEIIATFHFLTKKRVLLTHKRNNLSNLYPEKICYKSIYPIKYSSNRYSLLEGISKILSSERKVLLENQ